MRKPWLALLVVLTVLSFAQTVRSGQEVLDSLIDKALKNYPELAAATSSRDAAFDGARSAGALPDPMLSVGVLNLPVNSFSLDQTPMSGVAVGLSQKIPWPGKLGARSELANVQYLKNEKTVATTQNRIIREVTDAYLEYSYWLSSRLTIEDYLELLRATRQVADIRYANGDASAQEVLRVASMLSRTEVRLLKTDQMSHSSLLRLWRMVGDSTILEGLPPHLPEPNGIGLSGQSVESNPILLKAQLAVEQSDVQKRLARADYWPDITLGVHYSIRKEMAGDPVRGADFLTFRFGVNIPLWFFAKQKHKVRAAEHMSLASREQERSVRETLTTRLKDAQSTLEVTYESINQYNQSIVPEGEAALEAAEVAYEVGQIDFNALLTTQTDLLDIRLERLDLLRQYHQTGAAVAELYGSPQER